MKQYMLVRYRKRKKQALEFFGNKCNQCGNVENLQFDHIDRNGKKYTIAKIWSYSEKNFWEEIKKCQLLCHRCHNIKTQKELGKKIAKGNHGTVSTYRYCHCKLCNKAHKENWIKWYSKNKEEYNRKRRERRANNSVGRVASF